MTREDSKTAFGRLNEFIHHETTAGLILVLAALAAIVANNVTALRPAYEAFLQTPVSVSIGSHGLSKPSLLWINDGLMAIFFFLVGLEINPEGLEGNLSSREQFVLPAIAAVGGMVAPALIYILCNVAHPELRAGLAIPPAADIAFALGALSLAGNRGPVALNVFLVTLATLDARRASVRSAPFCT